MIKGGKIPNKGKYFKIKEKKCQNKRGKNDKIKGKTK